MSYVLTDVLQVAVFSALSNDTALMVQVNNAIYDALPSGPVPALYVTLGAERVRERSDCTARCAVHDFMVSVISDEPGFLTAKQAASRISELLDGADLVMSRGHLVRLDFLKANARQRSERREIEIWFRAFVEDEAAA